MTKRIIVLFLFAALSAVACSANDLVSRTAADAGYEDLQKQGTYTDGLGRFGCTGYSVAHVYRGIKDKRLVTFSVCCGGDNATGCDTASIY